MKNPLLFILVSAILSPWILAQPIERATIIGIPAGSVKYKDALLHDVLLDAQKTAAKKSILLTADAAVLQDAAQKTITLEAEGLTLDALLEFSTRSTGTEWKLDKAITVFSSEKAKAAYKKRTSSETHKKLSQIIIPEISFENLDIPSALAKVRSEAIKIAGLGSVPKIDLTRKLITKTIVNLKVKNASVTTLFDLLVSSSASSVELGLDDFTIVIIDEASRREDALRARREMAFGRNSGGADPFAAPSGGASSLSARRPSKSFRPNPGDSITPPTPFNTESYSHFGDNPFFSPLQEQLSTFSVDVDTASYSNVRRMIVNKSHVPLDATRIEEFVNYFSYDYAPPATGEAGKPITSPPFAAHIESASAPWAPDHRLVRIALKGYEIGWETRPPSNLVFLLDVSGSMSPPNKLGLVKEALGLLIKRLDARDRISIVVYAGSSGLVLPPTPANKTKKILRALNNLEAGGSTNGGEGIQLAYKTAREQFNQLGNNRVILCTDGDFNVGTTDKGSLVKLV
ncbi:MAG: vWA domain-containing protein, partial [Luteolibacter sp.]